MTVLELTRTVISLHREMGGEAYFSAGELVAALLEKNGLPREARLLEPEKALPEALSHKMLAEAKALLDGAPLQYYLGTQFFDGEEYLCREKVLIPRRDSEVLVRVGESFVPRNAKVFDFCCGSGCIGIALLRRRADLACHSFDLSPEALALTADNAAKLAVRDRLSVTGLDVLSPAAEEALLRERPALVLSNPPYIPTGEIAALPANVRREPKLALDGGADGLAFYRRFLLLCKKTGVPFAVEIGKDQEKEIFLFAEKAELSCKAFPDESGILRCLLIGENVV